MTTLRAHTHARRHAWWPQLYEEYPGIHPSIPLNPGITALLRIAVSTNAYYCAPAWIPVRGGASFRWRLPLSRQPFFSNLRIFFLQVTVSIFRLSIVVEEKSLIVYRSKSSSCLEEENSNREETFPRSIIEFRWFEPVPFLQFHRSVRKNEDAKCGSDANHFRPFLIFAIHQKDPSKEQAWSGRFAASSRFYSRCIRIEFAMWTWSATIGN